MRQWRLYGPEDSYLGMDAVRAILGGVSAEKVSDLVAAGRFPRPIAAGPRSPPTWSGLTIACWLHLAPMMVPDPAPDDDQGGARRDKKA